MIIERQENENERQFIWRLHKYVNNGEMTWKELADIVNKEFRADEDEYRDESAYRKPCQAAEQYYDAVFSHFVDDEYCKQIALQKRELEKAKVRFRDERIEYNKQNRLEAREEQKLDYLEEMLKDLGKKNFEVHDTVDIDSDNSLLVCLSDLHIGQTFENVFGRYDTGIAQARLNAYLDKILDIQRIHNSKNCYVALLGDMLSGNIHKSIQVTNRENVIEQIKIVSELIISFVYELSGHFENVFVQSTVGNHTRIDRKEDAIHDERLDDIIPWALNLSLSHIDNVHVLNRRLDSSISDMNIHGKTYILTHGDLDTFSKNGVANLSMFLGFIPYAVVMGHRHYCAYQEESGVKLVQSGSLAGSGDQYTIEKRLSGNASQMVCVCTDDGIICNYPIKLS